MPLLLRYSYYPQRSERTFCFTSLANISFISSILMVLSFVVQTLPGIYTLLLLVIKTVNCQATVRLLTRLILHLSIIMVTVTLMRVLKTQLAKPTKLGLLR